jgi:hypothetical protein
MHGVGQSSNVLFSQNECGFITVPDTGILFDSCAMSRHLQFDGLYR